MNILRTSEPVTQIPHLQKLFFSLVSLLLDSIYPWTAVSSTRIFGECEEDRKASVAIT